MSTRLSKRKKGFRDQEQLRVEKENRKKILRFIRKKGSATISETALELGFTRRTVSKHFQKLRQEGLVDKESGLYVYEPTIYFGLPLFGQNGEKIEVISKSGDVRREFLEDRPKVGSMRITIEPYSEKAINFWLWVMLSSTKNFLNEQFLLLAIFGYALRKKLIDEKYFSGEKKLTELSGFELRKMWRSIFGDAEACTATFTFKAKNLLEWLQTEEGKKELESLFPREERSKFYQDIMEIWNGKG